MGAFLDALPSGPCGLVLEGPEGIGKTTVWRAGAAWAAGRSFTVLSCRELQTGRRAEYQASEQRAGIVKQAWYLARTPADDQLIAYLESPTSPRRARRSLNPVTSSTNGSNAAWPTPPAWT